MHSYKKTIFESIFLRELKHKKHKHSTNTTIRFHNQNPYKYKLILQSSILIFNFYLIIYKILKLTFVQTFFLFNNQNVIFVTCFDPKMFSNKKFNF